MNFLRHPLYAAFTLGACTWLSFANARGLSFFHTVNPFNWVSNGTGTGSSGFHGSSHFSHK